MQPLLPATMANTNQDAEQSLREHLLAHASTAESALNATSTANIDPAIAGSDMGGLVDQGALAGIPEMSPDLIHAQDSSQQKKPAKRELSQSKRAQQNRAAQRAFRLRKESYIKKLEERVQEYDYMKEAVSVLEAENYKLRNYIINLQSSLLEVQRDIPAPPQNIDLTQPRSSVLQQLNNAQSLQASAASAAQAVAEMAAAAENGKGGLSHEEGAFLGDDRSSEPPIDPNVV